MSSPRIFNDLAAPPAHGEAPRGRRRRQEGGRRGPREGRVHRRDLRGRSMSSRRSSSSPMLDSIVKARGGSGAPTGADSAALRAALPGIDRRDVRARRPAARAARAPARPSATTSPSIRRIGLAGGACEGYGLLLDISDPVNPMRIDAVADSNFSYWHSATFNNDGTKILFSDEWGGGGAPEVPRHRQDGVGRRRDLHDRERQDEVPELLQDARRRRRRTRTAWRTTAR